ncbi:MAG: FlgB family protein [Deinococcus-Thermus bacterium]|jgi:flagellar basal-body rod protein FlgB|nr:FlgB family protein [Deinococcota bacterium]
MFDKLEIFRMAQGLARHAAARQTAVAQNVANVNTPGFRRVGLPAFVETYAARQSEEAGGGVALRATRAGHFGATEGYAPPAPRPVADAREAPNGNSVSLEREIMSAAELRRDHDMALSVYQSALGILRTSLGRR